MQLTQFRGGEEARNTEFKMAFSRDYGGRFQINSYLGISPPNMEEAIGQSLEMFPTLQS